MDVTQYLTPEMRAQMAEFAASRKSLSDDRYRPQFHYTAPMGKLNDPNGLCYFQGHWHLFYQHNLGKGWFWGHAVSEDGARWQDLPTAISPDEWEQQCWSGSVMIDGDRAVAAYYSFNVGIVIAVSEDPMLLHWKKVLPDRPVIPMPVDPETKKKYLVFDPCIWKKDGKYYLISGKFRLDPITGEREREAFLFTSEDLVSWEFLHPFLENDIFSKHADDCACPYFVPIGDKHAIVHFSHNSGPKYMLGYYDKERDKFRPFTGKSLTSSTSFFGGLHAPAVFPEKEDSLRLIYNINYTKITDKGLDMMMSLPMSMGFLDEDEHELAVRPADTLKALRDKTLYECKDVLLYANKEHVLENFSLDCGEIEMEFDQKRIPALEIRVLRSADAAEYTSISIYRQRGDVYFKKTKWPGFAYRDGHQSVMVLDTLHSTLASTELRTPEIQQIYVDPEEKLKLRIFIDKSVVEVFLNDKMVCGARAYPTATDSGVSITAIGEEIKMDSLKAYSITPIFE